MELGSIADSPDKEKTRCRQTRQGVNNDDAGRLNKERRTRVALWMANNDFAEQSGRDALTGWRRHCLKSPDSAGKLVFRSVGHVTMTKDKQKETERPRLDTGCCISISLPV